MEDGLLSLKWNNHKKTFTKAISVYRDKALYSDVTLACNGQYFYAHKIILSSCSEYFQEIFTMTQCKQPVIVLKDIRPEDVEQLLLYIYMGEVDVKQSELAELIKVAECLKIKGLATPDDDTEDEIPKKKKRKRHLSSDRPDSPKKQIKSSPSNIHSNESTSNQTNQISHSSESKEKIKSEPVDVDIIEEISTKFELNKSVNNDDTSSINEYESYEEKELPYIDNENMELSNPSMPVEYLHEYEPEAGSSGLNEDSFDNSSLLDDPSATQESNDGSIIETSNFYIKRIIDRLVVYSCTLCHFNTPDKSHVVGHVRKHTGQKPFQCQYCDYCSAKKHNVHRHERIHTGEKPYACLQCPYRFAHKQQLRIHEISKHNSKYFESL